MTSEVALELDVAELIARDPMTVSDFVEVRREAYRTSESLDSFLNLVEKTYPSDVKEPKARFRRGVCLVAAGRVADGLRLLEDSDDPLAVFLRGQAALDRDDAETAKEILSPIAGGKSKPIEYRLAFAEALARLEDEDGLRKLTEEFKADDPRSADSQYLEGRLRELDGEYEAAVQAYEAALAVQPDHRGARFRLAYRLDLLGRDDEAIEHYERLKQVFPVPIGVLLNLGTLYEDAELYEKAQSCYKLALAHDPANARAQMFFSDAQMSMEMYYDEEKERKDDKRAQILKIPVTDFELSVRSRNCLARMNIRNLGDLVKKTEAELLSFKNFGETSLNEIKEILRSKGLRLGMQGDDDDRRGGRRSVREIDRDSVRSRSVADLDLSVRSRKALDTLKVGTVGQLAEVSEDQLLACKNFGQTSLVEIKKKLVDLGLSLRG